MWESEQASKGNHAVSTRKVQAKYREVRRSIRQEKGSERVVFCGSKGDEAAEVARLWINGYILSTDGGSSPSGVAKKTFKKCLSDDPVA